MHELKFSKANQTKSKGSKKRVSRAERDAIEGKAEKGMTEAELQHFADKLIWGMGIQCIRMPDNAHKVIQRHGNQGVKNEVAKWLGGHADCNLVAKLTDKYSLCCHIELKSELGQLHGKQKDRARELPFHICRSHDKVQEKVQEFLYDVKALRAALKGAEGLGV